MNACNFIETANIYPNLNDEQQFKLNKINEIKDYFIVEIKERELMSKRHSKYIVSFDYFDKSLFFFYLQQVIIFLLHYLQPIGSPVVIGSANLH